jgi:hypothetical protein
MAGSCSPANPAKASSPSLRQDPLRAPQARAWSGTGPGRLYRRTGRWSSHSGRRSVRFRSLSWFQRPAEVRGRSPARGTGRRARTLWHSGGQLTGERSPFFQLARHADAEYKLQASISTRVPAKGSSCCQGSAPRLRGQRRPDRCSRSDNPPEQKEGRPRAAFERKNRRRPTLPGGYPPSTIGAGGLNCSVRNGKRCFPTAMTAGN